MARLLLDAGAEIDAIAGTYGADTLETPLNLLVSNAHPAGAGLQSTIAEVLLDCGAAVNGVADDEWPLLTALHFGYIQPAATGAPWREGRYHRDGGGVGAIGPSAEHDARFENAKARRAPCFDAVGVRPAGPRRPHRGWRSR